MDLYRQDLLDHYKNPHNFGHLKNADIVVSEHNVSCGDKIIMEVEFATRAKQRIISDIRFSGVGCAISMASASMLTDKVLEMSSGACMKLKTKDIEAMLGTTLTPARVKCAVLPLEVLQKAVIKK